MKGIEVLVCKLIVLFTELCLLFSKRSPLWIGGDILGMFILIVIQVLEIAICLIPDLMLLGMLEDLQGLLCSVVMTIESNPLSGLLLLSKFLRGYPFLEVLSLILSRNPWTIGIVGEYYYKEVGLLYIFYKVMRRD